MTGQVAPVGGSLVKAYLQLMEPDKSGKGANLEKIEFQFNPKEYTVQKSTTWKVKPFKAAAQAAMPEFQGANPRSYALELFLDASTDKDKPIEPKISTLMQCCVPVPSTIAKNKPSPPFVVFTWGENRSVTGYVKQVSVKYTMFDPKGTPTRAVCTIALEEIPSLNPKQNPTSGALTVHRSHQVVAGDSLASIAYAEYGDPSYWRALAVTNGIDDPARLAPGDVILVPSQAEAKELG